MKKDRGGPENAFPYPYTMDDARRISIHVRENSERQVTRAIIVEGARSRQHRRFLRE